MKELTLLIISVLCKKILGLVFFIHGTYIAITRWELLKYWKELAIINDVYLNVAGQHLLNQRLSKNRIFGDRYMTVSAAMFKAKFERAGTKWEKRINWLDKGHFEKAYKSHVEQIIKAYNEIKSWHTQSQN